MEGATRLRAQMEHSFKDINDPNRRVEKLGWMDWMDMDIEELAAEKKKDKERTVLDSLPKSMRVPPRYTPSFWPSLLLGVLATLHALVLLMQHWSVGFNVWINFSEVDASKVEIPTSMMEIDNEKEERLALDAQKAAMTDPTVARVPNRMHKDVPAHFPTHARIVPFKGSQALIPLEYYPTLGMTFEYHRRRFVYLPEEQVWSKIRCRTDITIEKLAAYSGFGSQNRVIAGQVKYGPNMFSVRQPQFLDLFKKQILNPFSVFQIFCVLLWAIDDYLVYSFFSLFMVLVFEATVVFQRLKSMNALRGMGNPSRIVYVYRTGSWLQIDTTELLPGDVMSLTRVKPHVAKKDDDKDGDNKPTGANKRIFADEGGDIVPADLLLLRGSAVVNEASLTGESVPQMKEGLPDLAVNEPLAMKGTHKMNVAYAGTKMLQCKGASTFESETTKDLPVPNPPDDGCICFVLRTGFASAQGKLVRMIEGSQEKVKGHERETGLLLLLLCVFAVLSSSYVLYHGMQDENRSKYELLLHCILIVTSVIRPELPMQMALAVNQSLMTLMKLHIFCTEPYRVPLAGKLDSCLFDKTGTLTTDELVAVGVCEPAMLTNKPTDEAPLLTPMSKISKEGGFVLAGCHSLVKVEEETQGDPLEAAALKSMRWQLNIDGCAGPRPAVDSKEGGKAMIVKGNSVQEVSILARHHFSSKLQRMSCVVKAGGNSFAVAKGSPEAVGRLLGTKPAGYDTRAKQLAKEGYRVIALAFKSLGSVAEASESRAVCEADLEFAGFIAFTCMVRKDTADVLRRLKQGGMSIAMITGDALLTGIHVAKEVAICQQNHEESTIAVEDEQKMSDELKSFLANKKSKPRKASSGEEKRIAYLEEAQSGGLEWRDYESDAKVSDFSASEIPNLSETYDLATTGKCLTKAYELDPDTRSVLKHIKVFARMTPDAKETVIECLHSVDALCLMCGDGANDVGALKQADVGVALLSGFGNVNVESEDAPKKSDKPEAGSVRAIMSQQQLEEVRKWPIPLLKMKIRGLGVDPDKFPDITEKEDLVQLYKITARDEAVKRHDKKRKQDEAKMTKAEKQVENRKMMMEKQRKMQERIEELTAKGESWAIVKAMGEFWTNERKEGAKKKAEAAQFKTVEGSAAKLAAQFEEMDTGDLPVVKLGDASVAAPFTSKMPSIKGCVDIVRQGRCTLVSSIQMVRLSTR